jgi:hypothetical protein
VKPGLKPATSKARATLKKIQALADRGIDGEKLAAQRKIDRLKALYDFDAPEAAETPDLFQGKFKRSSKAKWIYTFTHAEFEVANAVKWAIEEATGIHCLHRESDLLAEAAASTATRLARVADQISRSFRTLVAQYSAATGVGSADRGLFIRGLYDGMMNDPRQTGQPLPGGPGPAKKKGTRKPKASAATGLHLHPYSVALGLGRQIRFSVPLEEITAELDDITRGHLTSETA